MRGWIIALSLCIATLLSPVPSAQQPAGAAPPALRIVSLAEKTVRVLPAGELYWRIESFPNLDAARAAAGQWSLAAESSGRAWLFTLGAATGSTPGGKPVAIVGPVSPVAAAEHLLRINEASGPPGSITPVHTHPGSEAFFVLTGEQLIRTAHGEQRVAAGSPEAGHGAGMAMQVASSGTTELHALVMFVLDASKPFSSPATLP